MKFASLFLTMCGLGLAQPVPSYRITVVAGTTTAINYHHRSGSTKIGFRAAGRQQNRRVELVVSGEIIGEEIGQTAAVR